MSSITADFVTAAYIRVKKLSLHAFQLSAKDQPIARNTIQYNNQQRLLAGSLANGLLPGYSGLSQQYAGEPHN